MRCLCCACSRLLLGPSTYDIRQNPNYEHLYVVHEEIALAEAEVARVEAAEAERNKVNGWEEQRTLDMLLRSDGRSIGHMLGSGGD